MRYIPMFILIAIVFGAASGPEQRDLVPDQATAIKVAEAIWLPIYGDKIYRDTPFVASLQDGVWKVSGTFSHSIGRTHKGGTAYIEIQKKDCRVLKVTHYK